MDREILFRGFHEEPDGKSIAIINGKSKRGTWIYGNLVRTDDGVYIIQNYVPPHMLRKYEVVPSTVGQYTGLTDKNGVKIFEGDICKDSMGFVFEVQWDNENARFLGRHEKSRGDVYICYVGRIPAVEVIGNIHDNPELMGGEDDG